MLGDAEVGERGFGEKVVACDLSRTTPISTTAVLPRFDQELTGAAIVFGGMDRHKLWRRVAADYHEALEKAPDGFHPVVHVVLHGRHEPLILGYVRTRRDADFPWVRFEISRGVKPDEKGKPLDPDAFWVYAHEDDVKRVEIHLREDPPFDFFDYEVLEDDPSEG